MNTELTIKDHGIPLSFALPDTQLPGNSKLCKIASCIIPFLGLITSARIYLSMKNKISLLNVDNVLTEKNNEIVKELRLRSRKEIKTHLIACLINLLIISAVITCILIPAITPHLIFICIGILLIKASVAFINKITKNSAEKDLVQFKITIDQAKIYDECSEKQNEELLETTNSAMSTLNEIITFYDTQKATNVFMTEEDDKRLSNLMRDLGNLVKSTNHYPDLTGNPKTWTNEYIKIVSNQRLDHHTERVIAINAKIVELRHCFNEIAHRLSDSQKLQLPHT